MFTYWCMSEETSQNPAQVRNDVAKPSTCTRFLQTVQLMQTKNARALVRIDVKMPSACTNRR